MKRREIEVTKIYEKTVSSKKEIILNRGGARSSKSYSLAQFFIEKLTKEKNKKFLITRKTMPALRVTALKNIVDLLSDYGYYDFCQHNKTENIIKLGTNWMLFASIDNPERIKITEFNYIWTEEANEFTYADYVILKLRLSGPTKKSEPNKIFLSYNPSDINSWIKKRIETDEKAELIISTYKDNPFLSDEYVSIIEGLAAQDENYFTIYGFGEYAELEHVIYRPYILDSEWPMSFDETYYGLDFGFNNPSALLEINEKDGDKYLVEKLYQSNLTNAELIEKLNVLVRNKNDYIFADSAEPNRIEEISRAGFNVFPSDKSVKDGIDFTKRCRIHSKSENINLNRERESYSYKKNKAGDVLEEPIKFKDHLMDAKRYALYTRYKMFQTQQETFEDLSGWKQDERGGEYQEMLDIGWEENLSGPERFERGY